MEFTEAGSRRSTPFVFLPQRTARKKAAISSEVVGSRIDIIELWQEVSLRGGWENVGFIPTSGYGAFKSICPSRSATYPGRARRSFPAPLLRSNPHGGTHEPSSRRFPGDSGRRETRAEHGISPSAPAAGQAVVAFRAKDAAFAALHVSLQAALPRRCRKRDARGVPGW
jgi:hypothetical protein